MSERPYTPFEDCPHTWCVGCGTCHDCEHENPPKLVWPDRPSTLRGGVIPKRPRGSSPTSADAR